MMNKKLIISLVLSAAICAPYTQAMSILPKAASRVAIIAAKSPRVRTAFKAGTQEFPGVVPQAERQFMQVGANPTKNFVSNVGKSTMGLSLASLNTAASNAIQPLTPMRSMSTSIQSGVTSHSAMQKSMKDLFDAYADDSKLATLKGLIEKNQAHEKACVEYIKAQCRQDTMWSSDGIISEPLLYVMQRNLEIADIVTHAVIEDIESERITHDGEKLVEKLISHSPSCAAIFFKNLARLAKNEQGYRIWYTALERKIGSIAQCGEYAFKDLKALIDGKFGIAILQSMLTKKNEYLIDSAAPYIAQQADALMQWDEGEILIAKVLHNNIDTASLFEPYITNNVRMAMQCPIGRALMVSIAAKNPQKGMQYAEELKEWIANPSMRVVYTASDKKISTSRHGKILFKEKSMQKSTEPLSDIEKTIYTDLYKVLTGNKVAASPLQLVLEYDNEIKDMLDVKNTTQRVAALALIERMGAIEQGLSDNYYTFMHGRKWSYMLPEKMYRHFWGLAHNKPVENFAFALTKPFIYSPKEREKQLLAEIELRKKAISEPLNIPEVRGARFFMNTSLFGNYRSRGSNSFLYFIRNYNQNDARVKMNDIFTQYLLSELYEKYKNQCMKLEEESVGLSDFGQILGVSIPKDKVDDFVGYLSVRNSIARPKIAMNGEKTESVRRILDARLSDPSLANNQINFVGAMTEDALLNPESGVKISTFEFPKDPVAYAEWEMKFKELMQSMNAEAKEMMDAHKKAAIEKDQQK